MLRHIKLKYLFNISHAYYSCIVLSSCTWSISSNLYSSVFISSCSSRSGPPRFNSSGKDFRKEQLDFPVAYLENCKRISRWANWNSGWRQERSRWRHRTEICGDGIRFNTNTTYWDDGNLINEDGWQGRCGYSKINLMASFD